MRVTLIAVRIINLITNTIEVNRINKKKAIKQAKQKLQGHFPINLTAFFFKGYRITNKDFIND